MKHPKARWPIRVISPPYGLNGSMYRVMKDITGTLVNQKNYSVYEHFIKLLIDYKKTCKQLSSTLAAHCLVFSDAPEALEKMSPVSAKSFCERVSLTYFYKAFAYECWTRTKSFNGGKSLYKMTHCPVIGFKKKKGEFYCEHPMCPNCYMRKAAEYYKAIKELDPEAPAIVISFKTPFIEEIYGYNTPDLSKCKRISTIRKIMQPEGLKTFAAAGGIHLDNRRPFVLSNYHIVVKPEDFERKLDAANYVMQAVCKNENEIGTEVSIKKDLKVGYLTSAMYNACPLKLVSVSPNGFSDLFLHWTVNEFFEFNFNKKIHKFIR